MKHCWGNGCGVLEWKEDRCGDEWLIWNMALTWGAGVLLLVESYGVSLWKYIRRGWDHLSSHTKLGVGNSTHIKFWQDIWCGEAALQETFSDLYWIARDKDALVAHHLQVRNGSVHWWLDFIWSVQDWELEILSSFLELYILPRWMVIAMILSHGCLHRRRDFEWIPTTKFYPEVEIVTFRGKAFGSQKF